MNIYSHFLYILCSMFQNLFIKDKLIPLGPGALFGSVSWIVQKSSCNEKWTSKDVTCDQDRWVLTRICTENILSGLFMLKKFLKWSRNVFLIFLGWVYHVSSLKIPWMKFLFCLYLTLLWKYFVLESPLKSQLSLDFCLIMSSHVWYDCLSSDSISFLIWWDP